MTNDSRLRSRSEEESESLLSQDDDDCLNSDNGLNQSSGKRQRSQRHAKRRCSRSNSSHKKSSIKPILPKDYDGLSDPRLYHRFVSKSDSYICNGKVNQNRQIWAVAYRLEGKAYDFYMQKVADNKEEWMLHEFYVKLFNYCFPIDYRMQMQKKLNRCYQGDNKTITEYAYELQELFNMIGAIPDHEKVIKFWYGVKPVIQKGLWKDNLNPDVSTWEEVVACTEIIEIAENITDHQDKKPNNGSPANTFIAISVITNKDK